MFSMLVDIVTLLSLNLYINFLGGYLSTNLVYGGELLMSINTGFEVVRSCIPKTIKVFTTYSSSNIFFSFALSGFIKNSIEISFKNIFVGDPSSFLNSSVNLFSLV